MDAIEPLVNRRRAQMQQQGNLQMAGIDATIEKFKTEQNNQTKIIVESIKPRGGADKDNGAAKH